MPEHTSTDTVAVPDSFRIGPLDVLEIGVFGVPDLAPREVRVDGNGQISFPLAGTIQAAGQTPSALGSEIAQRLKQRYIRDPQVSVNLKQLVSQTVTVTGSVVQPGVYPITTQMTLVQAVATAKGVTDFAKTSEVLLFRDVAGQRYAGLYDLRGIYRGNYDDPQVFPGDVIVVGDSPQKRLLRDAIGVVPTLLAPLIVTLAQQN
jgi:polysaccharide export outer membrane protein